MANNKWLSRHPCFIPYLKINAFTISSLNVMPAVGFLRRVEWGVELPIRLRRVCFADRLLKALNKIKNR